MKISTKYVGMPVIKHSSTIKRISSNTSVKVISTPYTRIIYNNIVRIISYNSST